MNVTPIENAKKNEFFDFRLILLDRITNIINLSLSLDTGFAIGAEAIILGELASYFHERYNLAVGISHTGMSIGIMTIPLRTQLLIDTYGWRGCMLLLGGINLHLVVSGACSHLLFQASTIM